VAQEYVEPGGDWALERARRREVSPAAALETERGRVGKGEIAAARVLALGFGYGETYSRGEAGTRCPILPLVQRDHGDRALDRLSGILGQWLELMRPYFC
jgi:hypothetical protein